MEQFYGVFPYIVSPVNKDGTVRENVLRDLVAHLIESGVHGLTPLGSTGEFAYLTWEIRKKIVEIVVKTTSSKVPVVAGVFHTSSMEAARQAQEFEDMGVDGILAVLDTYFPLNPDQVFSYFETIAKKVQCPVVIYNNPRFAKIDVSAETIGRLANISNVRYLKDASGNIGKLMTIINNYGSNIKVFSASATIPLFVMMMGGVGWMAGPACIIPKQSVKLYNLFKEGKWDQAIDLQKRLWQMNVAFQKYNLATCIKAGLEIQGFDVGDPVPPLTPLTDEGRQEVRRILEDLKNY